MENKVVDNKTVKKSSSDNQNPSFNFDRKMFICITSLISIVAFSIFAYHTVDWSILLIGGLGLFLLFYPMARGNSGSSRQNIKRELMILGLISVVSCMVLFFTVTEQKDYAKVVVWIMAFVGIKLVFYPIYEIESQE